LLVLALGLCTAAIAWLRPAGSVGPPKTHVPKTSNAQTGSADPASVPAGNSVEPPVPLIEMKPAPPLEAPKTGVSEADIKIYQSLVARLNSGASIGADELQIAGSLLARYPEEAPLRKLLLETLLRAADQEHRRGHTAQAIAYLKNAAALPWTDNRPRVTLLNIYTEAADWPAVEAEAREMIAADARNADAWYALGHACFRQDRARDAIKALRTCLEIADHLQARLLLARIEKNVNDEQGMTEQTLAHFHVRYDGDEHLDVGREILTALERHYATLTTTLDSHPRTTIPVILFSRDQYQAASGAPSWSGGVFDLADGRIRIPIGGLTRNLSPYMDNTLMHELTHAFVDEKTGGTATREIQEGLAQYMAGDRIADRLTTKESQAALVSGRIGGVWQFYLEALSFVEYLEAQRGQGEVNHLLSSMGQTHNVDQSFREVYGKTLAETKVEWHQRLQQEYGT
jgi:tetratricopeptide (TPR) repeat protein